MPPGGRMLFGLLNGQLVLLAAQTMGQSEEDRGPGFPGQDVQGPVQAEIEAQEVDSPVLVGPPHLQLVALGQ